MPYNINLNELAIKLNIATDRLRENINTYDAASKLFPILELEGQKVGMYGGTAINKVYFGKKQRLSYDLDIFCYSYGSTLNVLEKHGAVKLSPTAVQTNAKNSRYLFNGVRLDLWEASGKSVEEPKKRYVKDLLYYMDYLMPPLVIPTYSLEYLLAEKTITMASRQVLKDIYDVWMGFQILEDKNKYKKYLKLICKKNEINDPMFFLETQLHIIKKGIDYYKDKNIDALYQPGVEEMIKDIGAALKI